MTTSIVTNTIHVLRKNLIYQLHPDALFHSDQGVQYTSLILKEELKKHSLTQSMSCCGNCWDNAPQESFYGHMKDELHLENCMTFAQLKEEIDSYMEYYNNFRYQWELKKMAPNEYYQYMMTGKMPY